MQDDHSDENDNDDAEYRDDDDDDGALGLGKWVMMMGQALLGTLYQEVWRSSELKSSSSASSGSEMGLLNSNKNVFSRHSVESRFLWILTPKFLRLLHAFQKIAKNLMSHICIALLQQHVEEDGDSEDNLSQSFDDIDNDIDNDNDHQCGG